MNGNHQNKQEEVICSCSGTTKTQIKGLIDKGMNTAAKIANETGAGTGCGSCDVLIVELLAEEQSAPKNITC